MLVRVQNYRLNKIIMSALELTITVGKELKNGKGASLRMKTLVQ